jgi:hypothetical protein
VREREGFGSNGANAWHDPIFGLEIGFERDGYACVGPLIWI